MLRQQFIALTAAVLGLSITTISVRAQDAEAGTHHIVVVPVEITLSSYAFTPNPLMLQSGTMYRLHLVNTSSKDHDFDASDFFANANVEMPDRSKISDGAIAVDAGQSVDVTLTPTKAGSYDLKCTHFLHATFGMRGKIIVQ